MTNVSSLHIFALDMFAGRTSRYDNIIDDISVSLIRKRDLQVSFDLPEPRKNPLLDIGDFEFEPHSFPVDGSEILLLMEEILHHLTYINLCK